MDFSKAQNIMHLMFVKCGIVAVLAISSQAINASDFDWDREDLNNVVGLPEALVAGSLNNKVGTSATAIGQAVYLHYSQSNADLTVIENNTPVSAGDIDWFRLGAQVVLRPGGENVGLELVANPGDGGSIGLNGNVTGYLYGGAKYIPAVRWRGHAATLKTSNDNIPRQAEISPTSYGIDILFSKSFSFSSPLALVWSAGFGLVQSTVDVDLVVTDRRTERKFKGERFIGGLRAQYYDLFVEFNFSQYESDTDFFVSDTGLVIGFEF